MHVSFFVLFSLQDSKWYGNGIDSKKKEWKKKGKGANDSDQEKMR